MFVSHFEVIVRQFQTIAFSECFAKVYNHFFEILLFLLVGRKGISCFNGLAVQTGEVPGL